MVRACQMVEGMINSCSVHSSQIAHGVSDSDIKESSIVRGIERFFAKAEIDYVRLSALLLSLLNRDKLILSIDRTEWDYGKTRINILTLCVSVGKMGIPIYFEMLDNNSGNSNTDDRISVMKNLIKLVDKSRIACLIMDREFIGHQWLAWLRAEGIKFCVRVPKHHYLLDREGRQHKAEELLGDSKNVYLEGVVVDGVCVNAYLGYDKQGDLLYLIGDYCGSEGLKQLYKKRWAIETFFQALKGRGFHVEASCLLDLSRYRKLIALLCISYTICWRVAMEESKSKPVRVKAHGYPQYSVFRRGLNKMREFYKTKICSELEHILDEVLSLIVNYVAKIVVIRV